jgi:hypothetical protein
MSQIEAGLQIAGPIDRPRPWSWQHGAGLAVFTVLASLSGGTSVLVLHRMGALSDIAAEADVAGNALVPRATAAALARTALARLDDANRSGNYELFRNAAAAGFQANNSAGDLARIFAWLRKEGVVLDVIGGLQDGEIKIATVEAKGMLRLTGRIGAQPAPLNFDLMYTRDNGDWRLFGVAIFKG